MFRWLTLKISEYTLLLSVHPTAPTPLKSYELNNLCLTPSSKTCSPNDNENIIYARGDKCDGQHFQFTLESDGVLRHSCSGKMVCPTGSGNGASLVVSSSCLTSNSKFERTQGKSERHSKLKKKTLSAVKAVLSVRSVTIPSEIGYNFRNLKEKMVDRCNIDILI